VRRARWVLTVRSGPRVTRERHATLEDALAALAQRARELHDDRGSAREEVRFFGRRIEPEQQVAARLEVTGRGGWRSPAVSGGVDLRGDGSEEAYTGRVQRTPVQRRGGESAAAALTRALSG
jgi:hypothetical protein